MDPRKFEYQNSFLFHLMQVWALTRRESTGALVVDAFELKWTQYLLHCYQESFGGRTTMFGEVKISSIDFGNYL